MLSVLSGNEALYVAVRNSARPLGLSLYVGMRLPAYLSGSGKAMLAQLPADEIRRRRPALGVLTSKGPRDIESFLKELALTKSAATASTTRRCAKASTRSARRCSAPRARRSRASRSASTRRSSAPTAAPVTGGRASNVASYDDPLASH